MLIAVLTLGGAILGATTLAGLLMLYQIRATTDTENSAKAIFAADAGVNWALYSYFDPPLGVMPGTPMYQSTDTSMLDNGATVIVKCSDANGNQVDCDNGNATTTAIAEGESGNGGSSRRAIFVDLTDATATFP